MQATGRAAGHAVDPAANHQAVSRCCEHRAVINDADDGVNDVSDNRRRMEISMVYGAGGAPNSSDERWISTGLQAVVENPASSGCRAALDPVGGSLGLSRPHRRRHGR
jgi:hypothetical protein